MSRERNKKLVRLGGHLIKERHDIIKEYNEKSRSLGRKQNDLYSDDYDTFVRDIANHTGQYDYFGHQLSYILEYSEVKDAFTKEIMIKAVVEYLLNYIGSDKEIDVVNTLQGGIGDYLDKVRPKLPEHIIKYLWGLQSLYGDGGSQNMVINKQYLWDYHIKDEVEERMLDPDWVSENSDDIDTEERLFKTYWHYPMTSLDWGIDSIYDHYDDFIDWYSDDLITYIFPNSEYHTKSWDRLRLTPSFDALFINRNEFIDNPEGK